MWTAFVHTKSVKVGRFWWGKQVNFKRAHPHHLFTFNAPWHRLFFPQAEFANGTSTTSTPIVLRTSGINTICRPRQVLSCTAEAETLLSRSHHPRLQRRTRVKRKKRTTTPLPLQNQMPQPLSFVLNAVARMPQVFDSLLGNRRRMDRSWRPISALRRLRNSRSSSPPKVSALTPVVPVRQPC